MSDPQTHRTRELNIRLGLFSSSLLMTSIGLFLWCPNLDLLISSWFYTPIQGFFLRDFPLFIALHWLAVYGAWSIGTSLAIIIIVKLLDRNFIKIISLKTTIFLLGALFLGPILIVNITFKDHWGRARPHNVQEFGGVSHFSSPFTPVQECFKNCSFVSGDASFGFYLTTFAYGVSRRRSRLVFYMGVLAGTIIGIARIAMGAHFVSDVIFAALLTVSASAILHVFMFYPKSTLTYWYLWIFNKDCE